jgi:TRAP-type mannitol/chloroaromatic compound transport system permease large subunit
LAVSDTAIIVIWVIAISVTVFAKNKRARVIAWSVLIFMVVGSFFVGIGRPEEAHMAGEFAAMLILLGLLLFPILWLIKLAYPKIGGH